MKARKGGKPNYEFQQVIDRYKKKQIRVAAFITETNHPMPIYEAARVFGITTGYIQRTLYKDYYEIRKQAA